MLADDQWNAFVARYRNMSEAERGQTWASMTQEQRSALQTSLGSAQPTCPYCHGTRLAWTRKFTTPGIIVLIAGLVLAPICIGIIMILISLGMREVRYSCLSCAKEF